MLDRQDLNRMELSSRKAFLELVQKYIDESDAVKEHNAKGHDAHNENFLSWHRYFLTKFEHWLHEQGRDEFIPCPAWNPGNSIPEDFSQKSGTPSDELRTGNASTPLPLRFTESGDGSTSISDYSNYTELNDDIENYHNGVHNDLGGIMLTHQSPKDPIFWPFHSMLTLVYEKWLYR